MSRFVRSVKLFEEYIDEGVVKKISPDFQRAESLKLKSKRKYFLLQKTIKNTGIADNSANDYVEYCYNIIMFLLRVKMLTEGYSSSERCAHESEVSFARTLGLSETDISFLVQLRYFRNGFFIMGKDLIKNMLKK